MTTLTFDTIAHDGVIDLPIEQCDLNGKAIKVIIMDDTSDYEAILEDLQDIIAAKAVLIIVMVLEIGHRKDIYK